MRAWRYREGTEGSEPVDTAAIAADRAGGTLLWVDLEDPQPGEIERVAAALGVHHLATEDLHHAGQRTKLERYRGHAHVAVHDLVLHGDDLLDGEIDLVFGNGWLMSLRHRRDREPPVTVDEAVERFENQRHECGATDEGFALWAILDAVVDRYFALADAIDERLGAIEDTVFGGDANGGGHQEIFSLRRVLVGARRAIAPLRDVIAEIVHRQVEGFGEPALDHLRDVYDHVLRALDVLESQRELLTGLLEAQLAVVSNRMNEVMKKTSSWGAILVVSTLIAGIYGMNFRNMPELDWWLGYPFALGLMALATGWLYRMFQRRDWL